MEGGAERQQDSQRGRKEGARERREGLGYLPSGPGVKTLPTNAGGVGLIPGCGAKITHAYQPKKPKRKKTIL